MVSRVSSANAAVVATAASGSTGASERGGGANQRSGTEAGGVGTKPTGDDRSATVDRATSNTQTASNASGRSSANRSGKGKGDDGGSSAGAGASAASRGGTTSSSTRARLEPQQRTGATGSGSKGASKGQGGTTPASVSWSTVERDNASKPISLLTSPDGKGPKLLDNIEIRERARDRSYGDVTYRRRAPLNQNSTFYFVPNFVAEEGIGVKGSGSRESGGGFHRGPLSLTVQPLEVFLPHQMPLPGAEQTNVGSIGQLDVSNKGGDYFADGAHQRPSANGGLALTRYNHQVTTVTDKFSEGFINAPYAWTRPDTVTAGFRLVDQRTELRWAPVDGERRDNTTNHNNSFQIGNLYTWRQGNTKHGLGADPLAGYNYLGWQQEVGIKAFGYTRDWGAANDPGRTGWYVVDGRTTTDRASWEKSLQSSGVTLRSESLVPAVGERTAAVYAQVDSRLLSVPAADPDGKRLQMPPVLQHEGRQFVSAQDVHRQLTAVGRTRGGYGELAAVDLDRFIEINEAAATRIGRDTYFERDAWLNTGTRVGIGFEGLAVPRQLAQPVQGPYSGRALDEAPDVSRALNTPSAPLATPLAPSAGELAVGRVRTVDFGITGSTRSNRLAAVDQALATLDRAQQDYDQVYQDKNWFQKALDGGREMFWGTRDAQYSNFRERRDELQRLRSEIDAMVESGDRKQLQAETKALNERIDSIESKFKGEYGRVFDEQRKNAETGRVVWQTARTVAVTVAAAAAVGAITVGTGGLGLLAMGAGVGALTAATWDAATVGVGLSHAGDPSRSNHFAAPIEVHSLGGFVAKSLTGQRDDFGKAAMGTLHDAVDGASTAFGVKIGRMADGAISTWAASKLGTTSAIGNVLNGGSRTLIGGSTVNFWRNGLTADAARFVGGAATEFTRANVNQASHVTLDASTRMFDPTKQWVGNDGKLASTWDYIVNGDSTLPPDQRKGLGEQLAGNARTNFIQSLAGGSGRVLNIHGRQWIDASVNMAPSVAADYVAEQKWAGGDGHFDRTDAARSLTGMFGDAVTSISSRATAEPLHPGRGQLGNVTAATVNFIGKHVFGKEELLPSKPPSGQSIDLQSREYYGQKYGVDPSRIQFVVTARHGQSATNFMHASAGNVLVADVHYIGNRSRPDPSLHWIGRTGVRVGEGIKSVERAAADLARDPGGTTRQWGGQLRGALGATLDAALHPRATLRQLREARTQAGEQSAPRPPQPAMENLQIMHSGSTEPMDLRALGQLAEKLRLRQPGQSLEAAGAELRQRIYGGTDEIWAQQIVDHSKGKDVRPAYWEDIQNPLTRKGESQAITGAPAMTALLDFISDRYTDVSVSPVLRARWTKERLFAQAESQMPQLFQRQGDERAPIDGRKPARSGEDNMIIKAAEERGQGYLPLFPKPGEEHGAAPNWWRVAGESIEKIARGRRGSAPTPWQSLLSGNLFSIIGHMRQGVFDNIATNMGWAPPSAAGKVYRDIGLTGDNGQILKDTPRARVRIRDETGYESWNTFDNRVARDLYQGEILKSLRSGHDVVNVSHQYTIGSLFREMTSSWWNPMFKQETRSLGAAVINGKPHVAVVYMDDAGRPRVLEAGYLQNDWAARRNTERVNRVDARDIGRAMEMELDYAKASVQDAVHNESIGELRQLEGIYRAQVQRAGGGNTLVSTTYERALELVRLGRKTAGDWSVAEQQRWETEARNKLERHEASLPAGMSWLTRDRPDTLQYQTSQVIASMDLDSKRVAPAIAQLRSIAASIQDRIDDGRWGSGPLRQRGEQVRDHIADVIELYGPPESAPSQAQDIRQRAARGRQV